MFQTEALKTASHFLEKLNEKGRRVKKNIFYNNLGFKIGVLTYTHG